ncbi:MAG: hypothetical protein JSS82_10650 [Bacteroidetes bacterium]|nr:hypothetical protein [Bacteroidota bacterium]
MHKLLFLFFTISHLASAQEIENAVVRPINNYWDKDLPVTSDSIYFYYTRSDTIEGIEVQYFFKKDDLCDSHLFFIEGSITPVGKDQTLLSFFKAAKEKYHYIFTNRYSIYDCNATFPDTFYYCRDRTKYGKDNFHLKFEDWYYKLSNNEFFTVAITRVVVDRFECSSVKMAKYFNHFWSSDKVEKIHYNKTLSRQPLKEKTLFKCTGKEIKDFECITTY